MFDKRKKTWPGPSLDWASHNTQHELLKTLILLLVIVLVNFHLFYCNMEAISSRNKILRIDLCKLIRWGIKWRLHCVLQKSVQCLATPDLLRCTNWHWTDSKGIADYEWYSHFQSSVCIVSLFNNISSTSSRLHATQHTLLNLSACKLHHRRHSLSFTSHLPSISLLIVFPTHLNLCTVTTMVASTHINVEILYRKFHVTAILCVPT